jgi:NAD(P)-dependent dehydrogenase (short-subunit alcohol dehydrogenase family)
MEFAGKTIIITGGSSGIGKATAKKLSDLAQKF